MVENKKEFTILITDDEKTNLNILSAILSPTYNVLVSRSGQRTLELAKENNPDLILLDVLMPEMSGFDVIEKLKESDTTNKIPVIFITGLTGAEDEERGFFLGAVDYITKPFNRAIVKARVNTHIKIVDQMRTIERIGLIDPLTKVSNRRSFEDRLDLEWGRAAREQTSIGILMFDVDKFKVYNDTYGHQQGDEALIKFADIASNTLKRAVDFLARWGGEEFVMLLPGTDMDGSVDIAEKVRKNIEDAVILTEDGEETKITVSVGVNSVIPTAIISTAAFINKADQALYKAKAAGRNRYVTATEK